MPVGALVGVGTAFGAVVCGAAVLVRGAGAGDGAVGSAGGLLSDGAIGSGIVSVGRVNFASRSP